MKFSLSVRQPVDQLQQADEISIRYNDINVLYDRLEEMPNKEYVVYIPKGTTPDWQELKAFGDRCRLTIAISDLADAERCKQFRLPFFWAYPIGSYFELKGLFHLGVSQVVLDGPLYFDVANVHKMYPGIKIRLFVNLCHSGELPYPTGEAGTYVRPEDIHLYEPYVHMCAFDTDTLSKERTLFEVYKKGEWNGNLNLLLHNLNFNVDNRAIPAEFGPARLQCRQNCMRTGTCHLCETAIKFSRAVDEHRR